QRAAFAIEPHAVAEPDGLYHQCVAIPFSGGVARKGWLRVLGQGPPVSEDLPVGGIALVEDDEESRYLDDLPQQWIGMQFHDAAGQAVRSGIPLAERFPSFLHEVCRPSLIWQATLEAPAGIPKLLGGQ